MKRKSAFRSMFMLALSLTLMLSLTMTASAATITIRGGTQAGMGGGARFTAYQIFRGNVEGVEKPEELVGIEWGDGVNFTELVEDLKKSGLSVTAGSGASTLGAEFTSAYDIWKTEQIDTVDEAEFVAQFMANYNNPACADEFARIIAANTQASGTNSTYESGEKVWKIEVDENGYYLVKDNYKTLSGGEKPDASMSSYILEVLGDKNITIKSSLPTVEKKVREKDGYLTETNKNVTFTLTGTVAQNISEYETYSYTFTDTLSAGLTFDEDSAELKVELVNGTEVTHIFTKGTDYTVTYDSDSEGKHILTITFGNLKTAAAGKTLDENSKIIVTYTAQLNNSAVVGNVGNPNTVTLKYSNNPYGEGTGESVPDKVNAYTLGLDVEKKGEDGSALQGVEFKLKNSEGEGKYAKLEAVRDASGIKTEYYAITGWADTEDEGTTLVTDAEGKFSIHGFSIGKYTLVETKALKDYEKMKDIVFDITGGTIDDTGALGPVAWALDEADATRTDAVFTGTETETGIGALALTNYKAPILPNTGGIGAKIVYVASGLAVLIGVCVVLAALRKRKDDSQK